MTKMRQNHTISSGRNTMSKCGILCVCFDTFSSKSGHEITLINNYNQSCSIDFRCCSFTGKEKDSETGYGYFGARYMDHELMTMWLSVDPLSDKYPGISPYSYCAWNPVKLVDPDGNEAMDNDDWYKNKETGAVLWQEGHDKQIKCGGDTYENIGESYSAPNIDGTYSNYYQNYLITIGNEQDASKMAYRDKGLRTFLISNRSKLPVCHKLDLFKSHVASRGFSPDMIGLQIGGNLIVGGGFTFDLSIGFVKNDGFFISFSPGAGSGFDISIEAGFCVGICSGTPSKDDLRGTNYITSGGYGNFFYQHSLSVQKKIGGVFLLLDIQKGERFLVRVAQAYHIHFKIYNNDLFCAFNSNSCILDDGNAFCKNKCENDA